MNFAIRAPKCACNYMLQYYVAGNACIHGRIYMVFIRTYAPILHLITYLHVDKKTP
jgi:hypothetical protein